MASRTDMPFRALRARWTEVKKEKGSYSVFYQPHEVFKFMISSVKWGKWWEGSAPMSNN